MTGHLDHYCAIRLQNNSVQSKVTHRDAMKLHRDEERGTYSAMIDVIPKTCQKYKMLPKGS